MRKCLSIIWGIILFLVLSAQGASNPSGPVEIFPADISGLIKSGGPSPGDYPGAGAVIILSEESMQVEPDGFYRITKRGAVKIFNQNGMAAFGEIRIPFNSHYQSAELDYARTTRQDGRVLAVAPDAVFQVTPPEFASYRIYTDFKFLAFTLPGLEPGSIIEFSVTLSAREPFIPGRWWEYIPIDRTEPMMIFAFHLKAPKDEHFIYKSRNFSVTPDITEMGDYKVYSVKLLNQPRIALEPNMPPFDNVTRSLAVTNMKSWEEFHAWWAPMFFNRINPYDPDINKKLEEITAGLTSDADKVAAVYSFVQREIRYVGLEFSMGAYEPHSSEEVLLNKYGDCKDMSLLVITMLSRLGIKAYPALINPKPKGMSDRDVPTPLEFSHVITYVEFGDGKVLWLDPTSSLSPFGTLPPDDQGVWALVVEKDKPLWIQTPMDDENGNRLEKTFLFQVSPDGNASVMEVMEGYGFFNLNLKSTYIPLSVIEREDNFKKYLNSTRANATFKSLSFSEMENSQVPFKYALRYLQGNVFEEDGAGSLQSRVSSSLMYSILSVNTPRARKYPFPFKGPFTMIETFEINFPPGYEVVKVPNDQSRLSTDATYSNKFIPTENGIRIEYRFRVLRSEISPEGFGDFLDFINDLSRLETAIIARPVSKTGPPKFVKTDGPLGEARILLDTGLYAEAERVLKAYIQNNQANSEAYQLMGVALKSMGNLIESRAEFEKALQIDQDNAYAYFGIGEILFTQGRWHEAEKQFQKAIEIKPSEAYFLVGLGASYYMQGKAPDAVPILERAVQLNQNLYAGHGILGLSYVKLGRLSSGHKSLGRSLAFSPKGFWVDEAKGTYKLLDEYMKSSGSDENRAPIKTVLSLGIRSRNQGYHSLAEALFREVTVREPSWSEGYINLARLYLTLARYEEAYKILETNVQLDPSRGEIHYYLAVALGQMGDFTKAGTEFRIARELGFVE